MKKNNFCRKKKESAIIWFTVGSMIWILTVLDLSYYEWSVNNYMQNDWAYWKSNGCELREF